MMLRALSRLSLFRAPTLSTAAARSMHTSGAAASCGALPCRRILAPHQPSPVVRAVGKAMPQRLLHTSRTVLADTTPTLRGSQTFNKISKNNVHVLDAASVTTWQEIPKGGINRGPNAVWKIWYNHAVVPIYVVVVFASALMCFFLYKYFACHVDIAFSKSVRGEYDHTGHGNRADTHDKRLLYPGMRDRNKREVVMFPFNFIPMQKIAENRFVDYNKEE